jgi:hypothetical protein
MPRKSNVPKRGSSQHRIGETREKEIKALNRRLANLKDRTKRNYGGASIDFESISVTEFKKIGRGAVKQFNQYKKALTNLLDTGAQAVTTKKGVSLPFSEVRRLKKEMTRINKIKAKESARINPLLFKAGTEDTGLTVAERRRLEDVHRGKFDQYRPLQFNLDRFNSVAQFNEYLEMFTKEYSGDYLTNKRNQLRENYFKALEDQFGEKAKPLMAYLQNLDLKTFFDKFITNEDTSVRFIYDKIQEKQHLAYLNEIWREN